MGNTQADPASIIEWVVLGIVVLAIYSIGVEPPSRPSTDLEVTHISGNIEFSTQSSLDAFGLGEFDLYADASVEIDTRGVVSEGCTDCTTSPTGVHLNGTITISNLTGGAPGLGLVEGQLDVTHLSEFVTDDFIAREWLSVDWSAGDMSRHWEVLIVHDPPRWSPSDRSRAAFVPVDGGDESRTGPWIFVETLLDQSLNVHGCLPDSSRCNGFPSSDINLFATREPVTIPIPISHPDAWVQIEGSPSTNGTPTKMEDVRGLMDIGEEVDNSPWCNSAYGEMVASQSWKVSDSGGVVIAPMSTWLEALTLPSSSFTPVGGTWSEVDTEQLGCAALIDGDGVLRLGISLE